MVRKELKEIIDTNPMTRRELKNLVGLAWLELKKAAQKLLIRLEAFARSPMTRKKKTIIAINTLALLSKLGVLPDFIGWFLATSMWLIGLYAANRAVFTTPLLPKTEKDKIHRPVLIKTKNYGRL